jgi:hypothetical protein
MFICIITVIIYRYHAWLLRKHDPKSGKFVPHTLRVKAGGDKKDAKKEKELTVA